MTSSSITCSRRSCTRSISHQTAGWNQNSARTPASSTIHNQSRRATCRSSWHATARLASSVRSSNRRGNRTTGCRMPRVTGCCRSRDQRNSARGASAVRSASMSGLMSAGTLSRRNCRTRQAPASSQTTPAIAPPAQAHRIAGPTAGRTGDTAVMAALSIGSSAKATDTAGRSALVVRRRGSARQSAPTARQYVRRAVGTDARRSASASEAAPTINRT